MLNDIGMLGLQLQIAGAVMRTHEKPGTHRHDGGPMGGRAETTLSGAINSSWQTVESGCRFVIRRTMNFLIIITHLIAFIAGIATDWLKKWSTSWFAIRDVRRAVQAEMKTLLVNLNFYILTATDEGNSDSLEYHYFSEPLFLESFEYYWQNQRDRLLMLPEWPRLKSWNEQLRQVLSADRPPLFNTIMLFEKVIIPPLDKCLDRDSKAFAKRVLARPEVDEYKKRYIRNNITGV